VIFFVNFVAMLQFFHKILAVIIAVVLLISTMSFTVEKHVCMGEVTSTSYFTSVESCGMVMNEDGCTGDDLSQQNMQKEKCCNDVHELIPGNQTEQQAIDNFELNQIQFVLVYTYTYLNLYESKEDTSSIIHFSPPIVEKDYQILFQSFLI